MGTSITEAKPTGYRPVTLDSLRATYLNRRFNSFGYYWGGGKTWEALWPLQTDIVDGNPVVIVNDLIGGDNTTVGRAEIEALIRRYRTELPNARIVLLVMPTFNNTTDPTNVIATLNADTRTIGAHYECTVVDWTARFYELLDAETYTQAQLYNDIVHPSTLGHSVLAAFLEETLTLDFFHGSDGWTGDLVDYTRLYVDSATFEDTNNYISINAVDGSITGTWSTVNTTERSSSEVDASIDFSGTFQSWGFHMGTYGVSVSIGITIDGGAESVVDLAPNRPYIRMGYLTDGAHTVHIRVASGTFHLARFLAI